MPALPRLYLDSNATVPLKESVRRVLLDVMEAGLANPSSIHWHGQRAKRLVSQARESIGRSLDTDPEQLIFTSSGTEANQTVIRSVLGQFFDSGKPVHWITSAVEHDSVLQMIGWVQKRGGKVSFIEIDENGVPQTDSLKSLIQDDTRLISLMWVNNETGALSPVENFAQAAAERGVALHLDGAQAWGKTRISLNKTHAQFVTFSGHKTGALSGTGLIALKRGSPISATILGKQEKGRRGGTENVLGIVALGAAAESLHFEAHESLRPLRDSLENKIATQIKGVVINSKNTARTAATTNLTFDEIDGESLVMSLDLQGLSVSAGSACSSGVLAPSHVLLAMGKSPQQALASVRLSFHNPLSEEEIERIASTLQTTVHRFRERKTSLSFESNASIS